MHCVNTLEKQPLTNKCLRVCPWPTQDKVSELLVLVWSQRLSAVGVAEQMPWASPANINAVWTRQATALLLPSGRLHPISILYGATWKVVLG